MIKVNISRLYDNPEVHMPKKKCNIETYKIRMKERYRKI